MSRRRNNSSHSDNVSTTSESSANADLLSFEYVNAFLKRHEQMVQQQDESTHNASANAAQTQIGQQPQHTSSPPQQSTSNTQTIPLSYNSHIHTPEDFHEKPSKDSKLIKSQPIFLNSGANPGRTRIQKRRRDSMDAPSHGTEAPRAHSSTMTSLEKKVSFRTAKSSNSVAPLPNDCDTDDDGNSSSSSSSYPNIPPSLRKKSHAPSQSHYSSTIVNRFSALGTMKRIPSIMLTNIQLRIKTKLDRLSETYGASLIFGCFRCGIPFSFPPRFLLLHLVESWIFDKFILLCIILNCVFLAMYDPIKVDSWRNDLGFISEIFFQVIFTLEMLLKIASMGLIGHRSAYLRQIWNIFDAIIVVVGFLSFFSFLGNISLLRAVRILRPLKALASVKSIKSIITSFFSSIPLLLNAFVLWVFALWLFAICGMNLMSGFFNQYCVNDLTGEVWDKESLCTVRLFGKYCPEGYSCKALDTIYVWNGMAHFSNIFSTLFTVFIVQSLEGWTNLMYLSTEAGGFYFVVYYIALIMFCTFFIMNLILGILGDSMQQQHKQEEEKKRQEREEKRQRKRQFLASSSSLPKNLSFASMLMGDSESMTSMDKEKAVPVVDTELKEFTIEEPSEKSGSKKNNETPVDGEFTSLSMFPVDESMKKENDSDSDNDTEQTETTKDRMPTQSVSLTGEKKTPRSDDENQVDVDGTTAQMPASEPPFYFSLWMRVFVDQLYEAIVSKLVPKWFFKIRAPGKRIIDSTTFRSCIMLLVVLNALLMTVEHYNMPHGLYITQYVLNTIFTVFFTCELVLKFIFFGPKDFLKDRYNLFDVVVVVFSLIEIPLEFFLPTANFSVFRVLRLLRVLKLANISRGLKGVASAVLSSLSSLMVLLMLLVFFVFITALLGMQLFGGKINLQDTRPNFDNLWAAMLTTFQLCTEENWHELVIVVMRDVHPLSALYFIAVLIGGNYIVLNLFIALLLSNVATAFADSEKSNEGLSPSEIFFRWLRRVRKGKHANKNRLVHPAIDDDMAPVLQQKHSLGHMSPADDFLTWKVVQENMRPVPKPNPIARMLRQIAHSFVWYVRNLCKLRNPFKSDWSLFVFPPCKARDVLKKVLFHKYFEWFLMGLIAGSSVILILDHPYIVPSSSSQFILDIFTLIFVLIFSVEAVLKIIAQGFILHKGSYLRSGLNALDFLIVISGVSDLFFGLDSFSRFALYRAIRSSKFSRFLESYRILRVFKTLRPIRFFNRIESLKKVFISLISTIPSILNVFVIGFFVYLIFGIVGVQLFAGKLGECSDESFLTKQACLAAGQDWMVSMNNFDNFFNACCALFESSTMEAYLDILYDIQDIVGVDMAKRRDAAPYYALYMIFYMMFGTFMYANLLVGVLIDRYNSRYYMDPNQKEGLTAKQEEYILLSKKLQVATIDYLPKKPHNILRRLIYTVVIHPIFETFIVGLVILNCIFMSMEFYEMPQAYALFLQIVGYLFTAVFGLEVIMKIFAFGFKGYFSDRWNVLDFAIQVSSIIGIVLQLIYEVGAFTNMFRSFRVIRLLKVVKRAKGLRTLAQTLWNSLPTILNILVVIVLIFYIYAVLGMDLFGNGRPGDEVGRSNNFETVWNAFIFLIRMATGENWNQSQWDYMRQPPECSDKRGDCINIPNFFIRLYFYSFMITSMFVLFNLFVAVVLENFSIIADEMDSAITNDYVEKFIHHWSLIDEEHTGMIPAVSLSILLRRVGPPFGVPSNTPQAVLIERISGLNLKVFAGYIQFYETLHSLLEYHFYQKLPKQVQKDQHRIWKRLFSSQQGNMMIGDYFSKAKIDSLDHDVKFSTADKLTKEELYFSRRGLAATLGLSLVALSNLFGPEEMDQFRELYPPVVVDIGLQRGASISSSMEKELKDVRNVATRNSVGPVLERALSGRLEVSDSSTPTVLQQLSSRGLVSGSNLSRWFSENATVEDFSDELPRSPNRLSASSSNSSLGRWKRAFERETELTPQEHLPSPIASSFHTPSSSQNVDDSAREEDSDSETDSNYATSTEAPLTSPSMQIVVSNDSSGGAHDEIPKRR